MELVLSFHDCTPETCTIEIGSDQMGWTFKVNGKQISFPLLWGMQADYKQFASCKEYYAYTKETLERCGGPKHSYNSRMNKNDVLFKAKTVGNRVILAWADGDKGQWDKFE